MDSSVSPKDEILFPRVYRHISTGLYLLLSTNQNKFDPGSGGTKKPQILRGYEEYTSYSTQIPWGEV